ncbi:hypothetical protein L6R29_23325 [Myxococcota bacterium]|nr:hypothetical protein [Myxococcota bacterium]
MQWTDSQRGVFLDEVIPLFDHSFYKDEVVVKRALVQLKKLQPLFGKTFALKMPKAGHPSEYDPQLDASLRCLFYALRSLEQKAVAMRDPAAEEAVSIVSKHLFPSGLAITQWTLPKEVAGCKELLKRAKDPRVSSFLDQHAMTFALALIEKFTGEMDAALQGEAIAAPETPTSAELVTARKSFEQAVRRLRRYVTDRCEDGDKEEETFRKTFFDLLDRAMTPPLNNPPKESPTPSPAPTP